MQLAIDNTQQQTELSVGLNLEAVEEWIGHREDLKDPLTERAIRMFKKKLYRMAPDDPELQYLLVEHAITMKWKGLHWVDGLRREGSDSESTKRLAELLS